MNEQPQRGQDQIVDSKLGAVRTSRIVGKSEQMKQWAEPYAQKADESFIGQGYNRLLELEFIDRSVALAAKMFISFFPFLLVFVALAPDGVRVSVRDAMIHRLGLSGASMESVAGAFAPASAVKASTGILGLLLLFFYSTSFTTALQRVYLRAWRRPSGGGIRNYGRGLSWVAAVIVFFAITGYSGRFLTGVSGGSVRVVVGFVLMTLTWWWTSRVMTRGEVRWRPLFSGAILTSGGMSAYIASAEIWMPRVLTSNQNQFGYFGVTLSLVSYFVGVAFVIVVSAALAAVLPHGDGWLAGWLRGPGHDGVLEPGARPELEGPTKRLRFVDALGNSRTDT